MFMNKTVSETKIAFTFPGVGVELCGHEKTLYTKYQSIFDPFFRQGSELAKTDLTRFLFSEPPERIDELENQFFIYCFSVGTYEVFAQKKLIPEICAGYSFGIYAALYAAGILTFSGGLAILHKAFSAINETCGDKEIRMSAVVGLSIKDISKILEKENFITIYRINTNNEFCHILCGASEEMRVFDRKAIEAEAISVAALDVNHPYHHPQFSKKAGLSLRAFLDTVKWHTPQCPVVSTIDQKLLRETDELKQYVADHLATPINWHRSVECLYAMGFNRIIECGPGLSLTQNARFIPGIAKWINCKNIDSRVGR